MPPSDTDRRGTHQNRGHRAEGHEVERLNLKQDTHDQPAEARREDQADHRSSANHPEGAHHHESCHVIRGRAEDAADAQVADSMLTRSI